jgi:hypothetical protein
MTLVIIIWMAVVVLEAYRHYYLIEIERRSPNRVLSAILRSVAAVWLWLAAPTTVPMELDQWWAIPIMEVFTFWFLFDLLLNIMRGRYFYYLGNSKWIDRIQKQTVGEFPAFFFKALLALAGITLCYYGLNAILRYAS